MLFKDFINLEFLIVYILVEGNLRSLVVHLYFFRRVTLVMMLSLGLFGHWHIVIEWGKPLYLPCLLISMERLLVDQFVPNSSSFNNLFL